MRIALVGPLDSPVSEQATGGTEVWTANFARQLVARGHELTVFTLTESEVAGQRVDICSVKDLQDQQGQLSRAKYALYCLQEMIDVVAKQQDFDVIHLSVYSLHHYLPLVTLIQKPVVITIHGSPFNATEAQAVVDRYSTPNYVFISRSFEDRWAKPRHSEIIYNGVDLNRFAFSPSGQDYFLWVGRVSQEKGAAEAVKLAAQLGIRLTMLGSIRDRAYFEQEVKPFLTPNVEFHESVSVEQKVNFYKNARAVLMPINWEEPFGLVAVEAMACGTPVVAYNRGALPEIITSGKNGVLADPADAEAFARAVTAMQTMSGAEYQQMRQLARETVQDRFSLAQMADSYEQLYQRTTK